MFHVFAITSEPRLAESLKRYYKHTSGLGAREGDDEAHRSGHTFSRILFSEDRVQAHHPVQTFRWIADEIEHKAERHGTLADLGEAVAVLDVCDKELPNLEAFSPIKRDIGHWPVAASMLVLAFPEIHWLLHTPYRPAGASSLEAGHLLSASSFPDHHGLMLRRRGFCGLLDPLGVRNKVRNATTRAKNDEGRPVAEHIPLRNRGAVAIDEEEAHAHFNAYTAYRFGYRACPVANWRTMQETLGKDGRLLEPHLLLEDLYLGFPDKDRTMSLSNLKKRDEYFPGLRSDNLRQRVLITVGHRGTSKMRATWRKNRTYLYELRHRTASNGERLKVKTLYKPLSGIFRLWEDVGKLRRDGTPRLPDGFEWPPKPSASSEGHSAPGRLLVIAERLIERSKSVLEEAQNVPEAIHAATLALEAKELLAGKTPTTALEALALQHRAEVVAESMFHGIEYNLDVENRFKEIKREVEAIGQWFNARKRRRSTINARLAIVEDLARTFRELNQFEEEQACLREARALSTGFWARQSTGRWLLWPLLKYINFSLRSLQTFFFLVLFWTVAFGVAYYFMEPAVGAGFALDIDKIPSDTTFWEAFSASTVFFFTLQSAGDYWMWGADHQILWNFFLAFQGLVSLLHLGLLVSHVYIIVSRR